MLRVGLTGGLASGKSFVGRVLRDLGCHLVEADRLGHEVLSPDGEAYEDVIREFGAGILTSDGAIDRKRLAAEVFGKPERLARLNQIVHPHVITREEDWMTAVRAVDPDGIAVVEAAILIETGSYKRFDTLVLAVCDEETQVRRAMDRDGSTEPEVRERLQRQMPLEEKRKYAEYVIDTSGPKSDTMAQVRSLYSSLRERVKR